MYEQITAKETERKLKTDSKMGLSVPEAARRLQEHGQNVLQKPPKESVFSMFTRQLNDPLIYILLAAAAISLFLRELSDAMIILAVIVLNGVIGVIQEGKALEALEALEKMTSPEVVVKRGGVYQTIPAAELVEGDIVSLETGCQVPADIRLSASMHLKMEESALTGESLPVEKDAQAVIASGKSLGDRKNMVYMSTSAVYGRGEGIVTATGMDTEIGKIAGMIQKAKQEPTPLQERLGDLGKVLSSCAVILCLALFLIAIVKKQNIAEMLITAISLAVAAVPEGLPAVVTIVLALSVSRMVHVHTIVRRLPSVETLGAVNVVCSDKTGTLTQNRMKVMRCYISGKSQDARELDVSASRMFLEGFLLCNDGVRSGDTFLGDPTETALLELGEEYGFHKDRLDREQKRVDEIPFDSNRKMMTTLHYDGRQRRSFTKGSCEELMKCCTHIISNGQTRRLTEADKEHILAEAKAMAQQALRVLGLAVLMDAVKAEEKNLAFVGLAGMIDPPREEAKDAIGLFQKAGVRTIMITGDHADTALAIARQLSIAEDASDCMTGKELDGLSEEMLLARIDSVRVFARVSPEHKVRIVKALKARGYVTAMTGDGVNDAPSLKAADIGIAMGKNGTDVAKNAADMVLTDDNFATIERAIEEGRGIYENIKKSVVFLLSSNFGEIITMFLAVVSGFAVPLKASHILWVNLITDSLPALALGVDVNDKNELMREPPRKAGESLFAGGGMFCTLFYGCLIAAVSIAAFLSVPYGMLRAAGGETTLLAMKELLKEGEVLMRAQTYAFTVLGISELFHAVGMRDVQKSIFRMNPFSNWTMVAAFVIGLILQVAVTEITYLTQIFETVQLSIYEWTGLLLLSAVPLLAHEVLVLVQTLLQAPRQMKIRNEARPGLRTDM